MTMLTPDIPIAVVVELGAGDEAESTAKAGELPGAEIFVQLAQWRSGRYTFWR